MKILTRCASLFLFTLLLVSPVLAQNTAADVDKAVQNNIGDPAKVHQVMTDLQQSVARHDAAAVAALFQYPITVNPGTRRAFTVRSPKAFINRYERIITPEIATAIQQQKYADLMVNYRGAMFGDGQVWIVGICRDKACKESDIKVGTIQSTANLKK